MRCGGVRGGGRGGEIPGRGLRLLRHCAGGRAPTHVTARRRRGAGPGAAGRQGSRGPGAPLPPSRGPATLGRRAPPWVPRGAGRLGPRPGPAPSAEVGPRLKRRAAPRRPSPGPRPPPPPAPVGADTGPQGPVVRQVEGPGLGRPRQGAGPGRRRRGVGTGRRGGPRRRRRRGRRQGRQGAVQAGRLVLLAVVATDVPVVGPGPRPVVAVSKRLEVVLLGPL